VGRILAEIALRIEPTIQSRIRLQPRVTGSDVVDAYTRQVIGVVAHLVSSSGVRRTDQTGARAGAGPAFLNLTTETLAYFADHLYSARASNAERKHAA